MKTNLKIMMILILSFFVFGCFEAKPAPIIKGNGEQIRVICLIGQSNCAGCSRVKYLKQNIDRTMFNNFKKGIPNVYINYFVDNQNTSSTFREVALGYGTNPDYFGPEVGMAKVLNIELNEKVAIVKYAYGGTALGTMWFHHENENGILYDGFLNYLKGSLDLLVSLNYKPVVTDICFMQGESDCFDNLQDKYYDELKAMVSGLREELKDYNDNEIYFIDAFISNSYFWQYYETINNAKKAFGEESEYNIYIDTINEGLTFDKEPIGSPDIAHYDSLSELKLGELFGDAVINHQQK